MRTKRRIALLSRTFNLSRKSKFHRIKPILSDFYKHFSHVCVSHNNHVSIRRTATDLSSSASSAGSVAVSLSVENEPRFTEHVVQYYVSNKSSLYPNFSPTF